MNNERQKVGWREWLSLPELGIRRIKAKIDTGARTSALHTFFVEPYCENGRSKVRFGVHPLRKQQKPELICIAPVYDKRIISDSGGHREERYIIQTAIRLGLCLRTIEISLTSRENMRFRMLLGRSAMSDMLVLPDQSYLCGRLSAAETNKGEVL